MVFVDANILVHAANEVSPEFERAGTVLGRLAFGSERWFLHWGVIYEFVRVATHPNVFPRPLSLDEAYGVVEEALGQPTCSVLVETSRHQQLLRQCKDETVGVLGSAVHDLHTAVLMREHDIEEVLTLDRDFSKFPWVKVRPLT